MTTSNTFEHAFALIRFDSAKTSAVVQCASAVARDEWIREIEQQLCACPRGASVASTTAQAEASCTDSNVITSTTLTSDSAPPVIDADVQQVQWGVVEKAIALEASFIHKIAWLG